MDKIKEKVDSKKPKEIYAELKRDDSSNCARDFRVVRNQKTYSQCYSRIVKENRNPNMLCLKT